MRTPGHKRRGKAGVLNHAGSKLWRALPLQRPDDPEYLKMIEARKIEKQQRREARLRSVQEENIGKISSAGLRSGSISE